jgi:hypothetical protein
MAKIQHTNRRGARYTYRRRIYLPDGSTVLLSLPLATADPATARARASAPSSAETSRSTKRVTATSAQLART